MIYGCVLYKNEEENIQGCMESLKYISDVIVAVDNGSSDKSTEIVKKYANHVLFSPKTVIDEGRNVYLQRCNELGNEQDWILVLDADERVNKEYSEQAVGKLSEFTKDIVRVGVPIYNFIGNGRFVETVSFNRIFRNEKYIRYNNLSMHATIASSLKKSDREVVMHYPIFHFGILNGKRNNEKRNKYMEELKKCINTNNNSSFLLIMLALEYVAIGNFDIAIDYLKQARDFKQKKNNYASLILGQVYYYRNEMDKAEKEIQDIISRKSQTFSLKAYAMMAKIYYRRKEYSKSKEFLMKELREGSFSHSYINYAMLCLKENDLDDGLAALDKAIELNPWLLDSSTLVETGKDNTYYIQDLIFDDFKNIFVLKSELKKLKNANNLWYRSEK